MTGRRGPPYRQGDLDGLCGVYAIVNAVMLFCDQPTDRFADRLFRHLMRALKRDLQANAVVTVYRGMSRTTLVKLIAEACTFIKRSDGNDLEVSLMPRSSAVETQARTKTLDTFWLQLRARFAPGTVAIVGLSGALEHWSLLYRVTSKRLHFIDSSGLTSLHQREVTLTKSATRVMLKASLVFVISRRTLE
jgi:hypothetical protein